METNKDVIVVVEQELPETPQLIKFISANEVEGFDSIQNATSSLRVEGSHSPIREIETPKAEGIEAKGPNKPQALSISMPLSPTHNTKRVVFDDAVAEKDGRRVESGPKAAKFFSQPIQVKPSFEQSHGGPRRPIDRRFDSFKTWSGKLERQITHLRGKPAREPGPEDIVLTSSEGIENNLPLHRYYDALEGPELDTLRASEKIILPDDKTWPFLLRFPISSFGICLGVSSQAIMWKSLATSMSTKFLHLGETVNLVLWCISVFLVISVFSMYLMKIVFYFEAVRREYYHPIRANFFFAPWIALLFLAQGAPRFVSAAIPPALWYVLMAPILCLELKIYGQWMSGGQRRLSRVANPSNHLSVVGNFVGALLGASMGLKEGPIFFFAVGLAHYIVLFVTLYQRLPTNETLPKELHPVFVLFVAAPSVASMAWAKLHGSFDIGSRISFFIAMFLYFSLAVRVNFFRGFKFSLAWWAYTFPMTSAAIAAMRYANEVTNPATQALSVVLSVVATLTVASLLVSTILHAFFLRDLFPNDLAIAISDRRPKHRPNRKWPFHLSSENSNLENYLKFTDLEASTATDDNDNLFSDSTKPSDSDK